MDNSKDTALNKNPRKRGPGNVLRLGAVARADMKLTQEVGEEGRLRLLQQAVAEAGAGVLKRRWPAMPTEKQREAAGASSGVPVPAMMAPVGVPGGLPRKDLQVQAAWKRAEILTEPTALWSCVLGDKTYTLRFQESGPLKVMPLLKIVPAPRVAGTVRLEVARDRWIDLEIAPNGESAIEDALEQDAADLEVPEDFPAKGMSGEDLALRREHEQDQESKG